VNVAQDPAYGEYLTDVEGRALYAYTGAEDGFFVGEGWEPLLAGDEDLPGSGVDPALMGEVERDGVRYRTYANRPLYRYTGDTEPGAITGHGMDESWWAVGPTGEPIETDQ
jgi:predicted lipoprotein with Yx(FWY)xxD motif